MTAPPPGPPHQRLEAARAAAEEALRTLRWKDRADALVRSSDATNPHGQLVVAALDAKGDLTRAIAATEVLLRMMTGHPLREHVATYRRQLEAASAALTVLGHAAGSGCEHR